MLSDYIIGLISFRLMCVLIWMRKDTEMDRRYVPACILSPVVEVQSSGICLKEQPPCNLKKISIFQGVSDKVPLKTCPNVCINRRHLKTGICFIRLDFYVFSLLNSFSCKAYLLSPHRSGWSRGS